MKKFALSQPFKQLMEQVHESIGICLEEGIPQQLEIFTDQGHVVIVIVKPHEEREYQS